MTRLAATGLAALVLGAGCVSDGATALNGVPLQTPDPAAIAPASLHTAERVQALGQRIVAQNPFTGLQPLFHTLGIRESVLFHRGPDELFISEGLADRCGSEEQLAAVLCSELGRMILEKRSARAHGVALESVKEVVGPSPLDTGEVVSAEVKSLPATSPPGTADGHAQDLLRGAGFEGAELARVSDLLAGVNRRFTLGRQIAGPAPAPKWQP